MAISKLERAKQFMAFDALKGLQEAYRLKEIEYDERKELSEERNEELSDKINQVQEGDLLEVKYYKNRKYITYKGIVKNIDDVKKKINYVDDTIINMSDIIEIKKI